MTIFVLTGPDQWRHWCHENYWNRKDTRIVPLQRAEQLHGHENPIVLKWGTWYTRPSEELDLIDQTIEALTR